jgi:hypothetical protein
MVIPSILLAVEVVEPVLLLELVVPVVMEVVVTVVHHPLRPKTEWLALEEVLVEWRGGTHRQPYTEEDQELLLSDTMLNLSKTQD